MSWKASPSLPEELLPDLCICHLSGRYREDSKPDYYTYGQLSIHFVPDLSTKGGIYWAVTAVNRFGYESIPLALNITTKDNPVIYYGSFPGYPKRIYTHCR